MSKRTENRLKRIASKHLAMAKAKPMQASKGTGKPKSGFIHGRHVAKETKRRK